MRTVPLDAAIPRLEIPVGTPGCAPVGPRTCLLADQVSGARESFEISSLQWLFAAGRLKDE